MGVVESTLREVEEVTIRPLGQVARTVEKDAKDLVEKAALMTRRTLDIYKSDRNRPWS
ncbi:DNA polymerase III PolC-type [Mycoavidus cysteinexigens]|uniref:DNA polymerase III PolC-type n=1 Tax=Mycoavidus cysteinexigens TaxID=1553431 RepID=A0A2Z6ETG0_9BURK|nr:hypothetical protein [Mycoavidus cysteinexigens]BBE08687.1 DNA polymerase III PolC-type [Mycoavidus cysteinexigens]GLR01451.1 hypothetical protein GCM10007934_12630 [Mycoavidus cysteinexigens]